MLETEKNFPFSDNGRKEIEQVRITDKKEENLSKKEIEKKKENKEKKRGEKLENKQEQEQKEKFAEILSGIFKKIDDSGIDWRLVGGMGLSLHLGEIPSCYRPDGTVRDVDIIVLDGQPEKIRELELFFKAKKAKYDAGHPCLPIYPDVHFSLVKGEEYLGKKQPIVQIFPHLVRKGDDFYLQFKEVAKKIPKEVFAPYTLNIPFSKGVIKALSCPPETLVHLYLVRIGHIKLKDLKKLKSFLRELRKQDSLPEQDHNLYLPFHEFAKEVRRKYKLMTKALELYSFIDYKLFHSLFSHKVLPEKIKKILLRL